MNSSAPALEIRNLSVGYKNKTVLRDISFSLFPGELVALVGPNGAGKTSLLKTIAGFVAPLSGDIFVSGTSLEGMGKRARARKMAFLFQGASLSWPFTAEELIAQGRFPHRGWFGGEGPRDRRALETAMKESEIGDLAGRNTLELSGGELQRVLIARAIAQEADVFLLDEPVSHLDPRYETAVMKLLRRLTGRDRTALVSLHDLNLAAQYADRVALIASGELLAIGPPAAVLREDLLERAFEFPVRVGAHPDNASVPLVYQPLAPARDGAAR
ncbi:ABC transporter ATP-binding protein [Breznakiella homolactica]|uniref:ABC transporter ATP-binding protein n=1 Tax=Breznakiella homolactica TaxID=2798577 RepID=A0A7T8B8M5_9SPIR|nr:ABC transporter ATP-binding protein [Breznakiella homolactica]QQO07476.1 ABC transporter ATP-binding protein [Breznakiella homolactica]